MPTAHNVFAYSYRLKGVGILCILWGLYAFWSKYWHYQLLDLNLLAGLGCWGLVFLFFSKEKIDDERIHHLKFQALTWALPMGLLITHLINYFVLRLPEPNSGQLVQSLSAYQALVIILLLAFGAFYFLKQRQ
jgi:hypothetical protein